MMRSVKAFLRRFPRLYHALRVANRPAWELRRRYHRDHQLRLQRRLNRLLDGRRGVFFLQIGSSDGVQNDPIRELILRNESWSGIFVEPLKGPFEELKRNYGGSARFVFENAAVGMAEGTAKFFYFPKDKVATLQNIPGWYEQVGSLDREYLLKRDPGLEPHIVSVEVECLRIDRLLERNRAPRVDLLHIDAEGHDYKILSQWDFAGHKPSVILYEHEHLSEAERRSARDLLARHGYRISRHYTDTLAVRP
jgi:FkbM family methyltransferase